MFSDCRGCMEGLKRLQEIYESNQTDGTLDDFHLSDPIRYPKKFVDRKDIETAGFIAAIFAIGPRYAILRSLDRIFGALGGTPHRSILDFNDASMIRKLSGHVQFAYKNISARDMVQILYALGQTVKSFGSLEDAMKSHLDGGGSASYVILTGLLESMKTCKIPRSLGGELTPRARALLASPKQGSACKRMNMFLRWMTRRDQIDFGIYDWLGTDQLVIPLDVNVSRAARRLKLTARKTDNWKTAIEITEQLKRLDPVDPVKYDVPLFLYGIDLRKGHSR